METSRARDYASLPDGIWPNVQVRSCLGSSAKPAWGLPFQSMTNFTSRASSAWSTPPKKGSPSGRLQLLSLRALLTILCQGSKLFKLGFAVVNATGPSPLCVATLPASSRLSHPFAVTRGVTTWSPAFGNCDLSIQLTFNIHFLRQRAFL